MQNVRNKNNNAILKLMSIGLDMRALNGLEQIYLKSCSNKLNLWISSDSRATTPWIICYSSEASNTSDIMYLKNDHTHLKSISCRQSKGTYSCRIEWVVKAECFRQCVSCSWVLQCNAQTFARRSFYKPWSFFDESCTRPHSTQSA